jgi:hypothetical protein
MRGFLITAAAIAAGIAAGFLLLAFLRDVI